MEKQQGKSKGTGLLIGLAGAIVLGSTAIVAPARRVAPVVPPTTWDEPASSAAVEAGPSRVAVVPEPLPEPEPEPRPEGDATPGDVEPSAPGDGREPGEPPYSEAQDAPATPPAGIVDER